MKNHHNKRRGTISLPPKLVARAEQKRGEISRSNLRTHPRPRRFDARLWVQLTLRMCVAFFVPVLTVGEPFATSSENWSGRHQVRPVARWLRAPHSPDQIGAADR